MGVIHVMNKGRSHSHEMNCILKHIYLLQAKHQLQLLSTYVASQDNIADTLSRGDVVDFFRGFPAICQQISLPLPDHLSGKLLPWSPPLGQIGSLPT